MLQRFYRSITRLAGRKDVGGSLVPTSPSGGWWPFSIKEPFAGAWQSNIEWRRDTVLAYHAIFACITLISGDISKLRVRLVKQTTGGIWEEQPDLGKFKVLGRPNGYQNRIQFFESWINSKMVRGNTYVLLVRNGSGSVKEMHVLNPDLVLPLVTPEGEVFYQLGADNLAGIAPNAIKVPSSEIIHDRFNTLCHPLVGVSPIYACGLAAFNGLKIQQNSAKYFTNMSRPSGILTAPGAIKAETAIALKEQWESNYSGDNYGRVAVLGDDLKYEKLSMTAEESQMVEQLRLTAEIVCSCFHVPKYKVIGDPPSFNNIEALEQGYYSQCLQVLIESIELLLDEGLEVPAGQGAEFDLDGLLRMDSKTQVETLTAALKGGLDTPNEARKKRNLKPLPGGDTVWMQQQQWPMELLAQRRTPPDGAAAPAPAPDPAPDNENPPADPQADENKWMSDFGAAFTKEMELVAI